MTFLETLIRDSADQMITENQQRSAWTDLMDQYPWHHYITLTFKDPVSSDTATWVFSKFIRRLERMGNGIWWCHVMETGRAGGLIHFHALLGGTDHLTVDEVRRAWWTGIAHVKLYDPELGATWYMTKDLESGRSEVEFSAHIDRTISRWKKTRSKGSSDIQQDEADEDPLEAQPKPESQDQTASSQPPTYSGLPAPLCLPAPAPVLNLPPPPNLLLLPPCVDFKSPEIKRRGRWWSRIKTMVRWLRDSMPKLKSFLLHRFGRKE